MSEAVESAVAIRLMPGCAEMWRAILAAKPDDGSPFPCPKVGEPGHRGGHVKALVRFGGIEVAEKGGPGRSMMLRFVKDFGSYEVREARRGGGKPSLNPRATPPGEGGVSKRAAMGGGVASASLLPPFSFGHAIDAVLARVEAEVLGQIAEATRALSSGLEGLRSRIGTAVQRVSVAAASDDQVAALKHEVTRLQGDVAAANKRAEDAMAIAGRARVEATRRETPIERAVRVIRTHGSTVIQAPKGGWYVNGKIARDEAWMLARAAELGAPAPEEKRRERKTRVLSGREGPPLPGAHGASASAPASRGDEATVTA